MKSFAFLLFCLVASRAGSSGLDEDGEGEMLASSDYQLSVEKRQVDNRLLDTGYIVQLEVTCASSITGVGELRVRADVPAHALAHCENGDTVFNATLDPLHTLAIGYTSTTTPPAGMCVMKSISNSTTFKVRVEIGWGESKSEIFQYRRQELVTCSYSSYGFNETASHIIEDFVIAPSEQLSLKGPASSETFSLHVVNVLDRPIDGVNFGIGRKIRLRASVTGSVTMRAVSCSALNSANSTYAILRGGCGDGAIFPKGLGFKTQGLFVYSPWFHAFKLRGANDIRFECIFIHCPGCIGSSCW